MRITNIKTIVLRFPTTVPSHWDAQHHFVDRSGLVVQVETDLGVTGHGYAYFGIPSRAAESLKVLIDSHLAGVLIGQDPFLPRLQRERLWHEVEYTGVEGLAHIALTALDTALWDIMARAMNVPGWQLLGACRERIPAYAMVGWYFDVDDTNGNLDRFKAVVAQAMEEDMAGVKIKVGRGTLAEDMLRIETARSIIGPEAVLMVDANQMLDRIEATRRGRAYQQYDVYWFEEPLRPHDKQGYAQLCRDLETPVATGENEYTKYKVQELLAVGGCDILQPDARRTGGPSEWIEIAGLAAAMHVPIASHGGDGVATHLLMATPSAIWCETGGKPKGPGNFTDRSVIEDGYVYAPQAPGFGMQVRDEVLEQYGVR